MNSQHLSHFGTNGYLKWLTGAARSATIFEEIHQHIITQCLGRCEEGAAMIHLGHLLDEVTQWTCCIKHKCVDGDVVLRASHRFAQCGFNGLTHRRIVEIHVARLRDMGCWFTVGDHDDLFGTGLASK